MIEGKSVKAVAGKAKPTLVVKGKKMSGSGGCNAYFGEVEAGDDGSFKAGGIGATEMACSAPGVMNQESQFFGQLGKVTKFTVTDENNCTAIDSIEIDIVPLSSSLNESVPRVCQADF